MKYRNFDALGWEVSVMGFGAARLPLLNGNSADIGEGLSVEMLRYAVDNGVNYIDAGYSYDAVWQEKTLRLLGKALADGYREKVKIAVTVPARLIKKSGDFDRRLEEQLVWLGDGRADFCLLGGLNRATWPDLQEIRVISRADKAITDKRIDKLGFSFHDYFQALRNVIEEYDNWTLCSFQYSYMDVDHHPGYGGLKYAADKGLAVIATEPHLGGRLTAKPPESVAAVREAASQKRTPSDWALSWVWHHEEVSTVVSNMSTIEQVKENIALSGGAEAGSLNVQEQVLVSRVRDAYRKLKPVPCTACRACMPCVQGIDVPRIFEIYNDAMMYGDMETARSIYSNEGHRIESCTACGDCANACGRQIAILDRLDEVKKCLSE